MFSIEKVLQSKCVRMTATYCFPFLFSTLFPCKASNLRDGPYSLRTCSLTLLAPIIPACRLIQSFLHFSLENFLLFQFNKVLVNKVNFFETFCFLSSTFEYKLGRKNVTCMTKGSQMNAEKSKEAGGSTGSRREQMS